MGPYGGAPWFTGVSHFRLLSKFVHKKGGLILPTCGENRTAFRDLEVTFQHIPGTSSAALPRWSARPMMNLAHKNDFGKTAGSVLQIRAFFCKFAVFFRNFFAANLKKRPIFRSGSQLSGATHVPFEIGNTISHYLELLWKVICRSKLCNKMGPNVLIWPSTG